MSSCLSYVISSADHGFIAELDGVPRDTEMVHYGGSRLNGLVPVHFFVASRNKALRLTKTGAYEKLEVLSPRLDPILFVEHIGQRST